jgi:uncharacterized protein
MKELTAPKRRINPKFARFRVKIGRSAMHRYGVSALEDIPAGRRVMEYTGKRLTLEQAGKISPPEDLYIAWLKPGWFVDGRRQGSGAQFVNHSCKPNAATRRMGGPCTCTAGRRSARAKNLPGIITVR